jgi:hypothetical protein
MSKTLGDMTPPERAAAISRAASAFQAELDATAPTIGEILEADTDPGIAARLEYLRGEIRAERISWSEIAELQSLAAHIEPGDTELLEWAGVAEN